MDLFTVNKEELQSYLNELKEDAARYQRMLCVLGGNLASDFETFLMISIKIKENLITQIEELINEFK